MRIWVEGPIPYTKKGEFLYDAIRKNLEAIARQGTNTELHWPKVGYTDPTYAWTRSYNAIEGVKSVYEAWKKGYDAFVISCMMDPGLTEARSIVDIPVTAGLESAAMVACLLGSKFSIIGLHAPSEPIYADRVDKYGLSARLASIRCAGLTSVEAMDLYAYPEKLINTFSGVAVKAIREDGAETIILGCTAVSSIFTAREIYEIENVPLVNGVVAAVKIAEVMVDLRNAYGTEVCRKSVYAAAPDWENEIPIKF
jgi:Asp/Glu/hydantoin racemase